VFGAKSIKGKVAAISLGLALAAMPCFAQRFRLLAQQKRPAASQRPAVPRPEHHAGQWLRQYKNLPPGQQEKALQNDPQFRNLPPERQQILRQRLQHFNSLPPQQQDRVINRMETWEHLTPEQKAQARQTFGQFRQLPPDRQRMVRTAISGLRGMPPDQRQQVINSERFKSMFSPQEREILNGAMKLPLAPPEAGQNEPGPER